jgi:hypothetical protein
MLCSLATLPAQREIRFEEAHNFIAFRIETLGYFNGYVGSVLPTVTDVCGNVTENNRQ